MQAGAELKTTKSLINSEQISTDFLQTKVETMCQLQPAIHSGTTLAYLLCVWALMFGQYYIDNFIKGVSSINTLIFGMFSFKVTCYHGERVKQDHLKNLCLIWEKSATTHIGSQSS